MSKISVIVPVYKVEPYLSRCVDSILGQSFTDFELILVDDGSPDHCPSMCDEYAQRDSRVHVIHQENRGLSAARNAGIDWAFANSDSEWLNFVDSDDWMHPKALESLWNAVRTSHICIAAFGYQKTFGDIEEPAKESFDVALRTPEEFYIYQNVKATVAWGKLYHKECFKSIRYPVGKIHEDEFVTYRLLFAEKHIAVMDAPLYYYFINAEGIMKSVWNPKRMDTFEAYQEQFSFFRSIGNTRILTEQIKHCLYTYKRQIEEIQAQDRYREYIKVLQKQMRKLIWVSWKLHPLSFPKDTWIYETAFPVTMRFYWKIHSIIKR